MQIIAASLNNAGRSFTVKGTLSYDRFIATHGPGRLNYLPASRFPVQSFPSSPAVFDFFVLA